MRYLRTGMGGVLAAAVLLGCGPGKELPEEIPKSTAPDRGVTEVKDKIPATSDPTAVEVVERAIKSHTQNNPALVARGKTSRVTAKGNIKLGGDRLVPSSRLLLAKWPDDLKVTYNSLPPESDTVTFILHGGFTWWGKNGVAIANLNPQKVEEDMRADGFGSHWLILLFPLTERNVVIYDLRKGVGVGTPPADAVRVSIPGRPVYRLQFAPDTGLLTQIDYSYTDVLGPALNEWMLSDYKPFGGLLLPSQMKMARTTDHPKFRDVVQEWTIENWEFPEKLDEGAFDPPK
jgi:hypothetical protein